jgi:hypothetical protein
MKSQTISRVTAPMDRQQEMTDASNVMKGIQGTDWNRQDLEGNLVTPRKRTGRMARCREMGEGQRRRAYTLQIN